MLAGATTYKNLRVCISGFTALESYGLGVCLEGITSNLFIDPKNDFTSVPLNGPFDLYIICLGTDFDPALVSAISKAPGIAEAMVFGVLEEPTIAVIQFFASIETKGFLLRSELNKAEIRKALDSTFSEGLQYISSNGDFRLHIAETLRGTNEVKQSFELLSANQKRVINMAAAGYTSEEIGEIMLQSRSNITTLRTQIISSLQTSNFFGAISICFILGLLDTDLIYRTYAEQIKKHSRSERGSVSPHIRQVG